MSLFWPQYLEWPLGVGISGDMVPLYGQSGIQTPSLAPPLQVYLGETVNMMLKIINLTAQDREFHGDLDVSAIHYTGIGADRPFYQQALSARVPANGGEPRMLSSARAGQQGQHQLLLP